MTSLLIALSAQPLHIAIGTGRMDIVRSLLGSIERSILLKRDSDGQMPLHSAIKLGFSDIVQQLLESCPDEALHTENGLGETPLEMATFRELHARTTSTYIQEINTPKFLASDGSLSTQQYFDVTKQEVEIPKLRATLDQLLEDGRLKKGTKITTELLAFVVSMEAKLATAKTRVVAKVEETSKDSVRANTDRCDAKKTLTLVQKAVLERPGMRQLVHLVDVQKSVEDNLARVEKVPKRVANVDQDEMATEESALERQKSKSIVFSFVKESV